MVGDGRALISLTGVCLCLAGAFALFQSATGHFLPHDTEQPLWECDERPVKRFRDCISGTDTMADRAWINDYAVARRADFGRGLAGGVN